MRNFKLRPHHGLCIRFFEGKGYSSDFTRNMAEIIVMLNREDPVIQLHTDTDIICRSCPGNISERCESFTKVQNYDNAVLNFCGLKNGQQIQWSEFSHAVQTKIIMKSKRESICGDCQWNEICAKKLPEL